jgi:guanylate kinase
MEEQKPTLNLLHEFEAVLASYQLSDHAKQVLSDAKLVVMLGLAGGGRNTLINYLVKTAPFYFIVSDTTRPPKIRNGALEEHGTHYFFRDESAFLADLKAGEFIEAEIIHNQQVSGTSIRELQRAAEEGLVGIHDYDIGGASNLYQLKPDAYMVALLPPDFVTWQDRLQQREVMHPDEYANRMKTAARILQTMLERPYFKFIISDDVHRSSAHIRDLVEHNIYTDEQHQTGLKVAREILDETTKLLATI